MTIYDKLLNPYPVLLSYLEQLNRQINLDIASFNPERFGSLTAARRSGKPFIIGIIPPDNIVNFMPVETKKQTVQDLGTSKGASSSSPASRAAATVAGELPFTPSQLTQMAKNGTLGPANGPIVDGKGNLVQANLDILANSGFFGTVNTVAKRRNIPNPADILVVCFGESKLGSNAVNPYGGASGVFQMLSVEINKTFGNTSRGMAPFFKDMSASQQMVYYDQYVSNYQSKVTGDQPLNALQLYLMNAGKPHLVKQINNPNAQVLTDDEYKANTPKGSAFSPLDHDKNGKITISDMQFFVNNIRNDPGYKAAVEVLNQTISNTPVTATTTVLTEDINSNTTRGIMSYGGVTEAETDDITLRLGKNIAIASAERVAIAQTQTKALQDQINILNDMPPLLMLVNPSEFTRNYEHTADSGIKGRHGHIVHIWLERPMKINSRGTSAGQYAMAAGGFGGLTTENRVNSLSYQNLMSLAMIYKNNGVLFTGSEVGSQAGIPILACSIYIYYDNHIYIGSFNDFSIEDDANKPFNMAYTFSFDVRYDLDVDSSQLIETRIAR